MELFDLKRELGEQVTRIQKDTDISLGELSSEIFGDENKLIEVFDSFDLIHHLENELARRCLNDFKFR